MEYIERLNMVKKITNKTTGYKYFLTELFARMEILKKDGYEFYDKYAYRITSINTDEGKQTVEVMSLLNGWGEFLQIKRSMCIITDQAPIIIRAIELEQASLSSHIRDLEEELKYIKNLNK